jgi:hypothetical protein
MNWEREFFKHAGFMLLSRYQVLNGRLLTKVKSNHAPKHPVRFFEMSLLGYTDTIKEMEEILKERRKK